MTLHHIHLQQRREHEHVHQFLKANPQIASSDGSIVGSHISVSSGFTPEQASLHWPKDTIVSERGSCSLLTATWGIVLFCDKQEPAKEAQYYVDPKRILGNQLAQGLAAYTAAGPLPLERELADALEGKRLLAEQVTALEEAAHKGESHPDWEYTSITAHGGNDAPVTLEGWEPNPAVRSYGWLGKSIHFRRRKRVANLSPEQNQTTTNT